jgi:hypothetical protein
VLQQGEHLDLTPGQQSVGGAQAAVCAPRYPGNDLQSPRREMDRVDHITRLRISAETGARPERKRLRALDRRGIVPQQEDPGRGVGAGELAHLSQLDQGAEVEDRHVGMVSAQHNADSPWLHISSDNAEAWIAIDQLAQPSGKEIVEVGEDYGDGGM